MSTPQYSHQGQPVQVVQQQPVPPIQQQPQYAPPVTAAALPQTTGGVAYYSPQGAPGVPAGQVMLVAPMNQPNYAYVPNDFWTLTVVTAIICGLFSPVTLLCTVPAALSSLQSRQSAKSGLIDKARQEGMTAAYLDFAAVIAALVLACVCIGLVLGLYGPQYYGYGRYRY